MDQLAAAIAAIDAQEAQEAEEAGLSGRSPQQEAGAAGRGAARSEAELRGMSEDEQLAYALSLSDTALDTLPPSARSPLPPPAAARLATEPRPAALHGVEARAPAGGDMSEDEQLAYALSLSMDDGHAPHAPPHAQTDEQLALALSQEEERLAQPQPTAAAAVADADRPSMRVRVLGGEEVPADGVINVRAHVAYALRLEMAGGSSTECVAHRFSDFAALLDRLKKGGVPGGGAAGQRLAVEGWARRLLVERRHTGSRARAEGVVTTRCKLLQKMMDELMALPEFASSPEVGAFLFG